jgi:cell division protein ZapB
METENLKKLERRIDELIETCRRLSQENQALKSGQEHLAAEHAELMQKTQIARTRIEAMIGRLKALERSG